MKYYYYSKDNIIRSRYREFRVIKWSNYRESTTTLSYRLTPNPCIIINGKTSIKTNKQLTN